MDTINVKNTLYKNNYLYESIYTIHLHDNNLISENKINKQL